MSQTDAIDFTYGTTSIPPTGIWVTTANQFFCQMTKDDARCINSSQFAAQPFDELCPTGDCWTDCQDLERLYTPLPDSITFTNQTAYGTPPNVTFWPLCAGLANLTQALLDGVAPEADAASFRSFFANNTQDNLREVAAATTQCWTDTCAQARHSEDCTPRCAAVNLLESRISTQFAGTRECIQSLCLNITGLPFGNQDIVGIGVSISYVIQSVLIVLCWITLTVNGYVSSRNRRLSKEARLSESHKVFLENVSSFQAAQCYFSIPLAIAALFTNPFTLDPLNAFGLLPVSTNGFLPEIFTLMIMNHNGVRSWYPFMLTWISYILNTITFWAVIDYLSGIKGQGIALKLPAFQSLGGIDSCGGSTGIGICLQFQRDSPPAFLIQKYGSIAWVGIRLAPWIWAWCTICLLLLTFFQFETIDIGEQVKNRIQRTLQKSSIGPVQGWAHRALRGAVVYYVASVMFFLGLVYQAAMFYSFLSLGLVDLQTWTFGQIVAITVWIPPVVDYLHGQFGVQLQKIYAPKRTDQLSPGSHELLPKVSTDHSQFKTQGYAQAAGSDDDDEDPQLNRVNNVHSDDGDMDISAKVTPASGF